MKSIEEIQKKIQLIEAVLKDNGETIPLTPRIKQTLRASLTNCYWVLNSEEEQ